jgi:hypothetical protein
VVLEQRDSLLALAERLGQLEPVEVAVAAQLSLLVSAASPLRQLSRYDGKQVAAGRATPLTGTVDADSEAKPRAKRALGAI